MTTLQATAANTDSIVRQTADWPDHSSVRSLLDALEQIIVGYIADPESDISAYEEFFDAMIPLLEDQTEKAVRFLQTSDVSSASIGYELWLKLPATLTMLSEDAAAAYAGDPAARSIGEILLSYPGFKAILIFRIAHALHELGVPVIPRMMTEDAHSRFGIDIHPGATIGGGFFIDHGTGVVIGETTEIGKNVRLYQGVTLGASNLNDVEQVRGKKRHPTIEDGVIIYAGATLLGGRMAVGKNSVIGGNVWLINAVIPEHTMVTQDRSTLNFVHVPLHI